MPELLKRIVLPFHQDTVGDQDFIIDRRHGVIPVVRPFHTLTSEIIDEARDNAVTARKGHHGHNRSFRNSLELQKKRGGLAGKIGKFAWKNDGPLPLYEGQRPEKLQEYFLY